MHTVTVVDGVAGDPVKSNLELYGSRHHSYRRLGGAWSRQYLSTSTHRRTDNFDRQRLQLCSLLLQKGQTEVATDIPDICDLQAKPLALSSVRLVKEVPAVTRAFFPSRG